MRALCLLVLISACGKRSAPAPAAPPPVIAVAPVDAGAPAEPAVLPPGIDPKRASLALALCDAAYDPESKAVGCTSHPPFASPPRPGGKLVPWTGDLNGLCRIEAAVPGAYTRADADELLVSFEACAEDGTWDSGFPGSTVIVDRASLRPVAYAGREVTQCVRPVVDGRTVFVCRASFNATVAGQLDSVYLVDFARKEDPAVTLARVWSQDGCDQDMATPQAGFSKVDVGEPAIVNGDVTVRVRRAWAAPTPALLARAKAMCTQPTAAAGGSLLPPVQRTTLTFARAKGFRPDAASAKVLARWEKETAGIHGGLEGAAPPLLE